MTIEHDQDGDPINWKHVAMSFYYGCGAIDGCGCPTSLDNLCTYYAMNLESEECRECGTDKDLEWIGHCWTCPECKELFEEPDDE